ncbi:helix-turn-helix domain-containing protein [Chromohalobacter israelensis]|uniref:helix-turn-helix domain-containing protein n=1 Tax=Halomonadaceae TaxID=28256 RepID=UPI0005578ED4
MKQSIGYRQLTQTQRYQIHARYDLGISQRQIGRVLGIHSSTISRELRRNATAIGYDLEQAQVRSDHRRRTAWKWTKRLFSMIIAVAGRLREEWSPEQISGFMVPLAGVGVSQQWIYSLIWDDKARGGAPRPAQVAQQASCPGQERRARQNSSAWASSIVWLRFMTGYSSGTGRVTL